VATAGGRRAYAGRMEGALNQFRDRLLAAQESEHPFVTATLDLRRGGTAGEPTAHIVVEQALREGASAEGVKSAADTKSFNADREALRQAIDEATSAGAQGLAFAGSAGAGFRAEIRLPLPFRNDVRVGKRPWLFEVERFIYLHGRPVVLILADTHTVEMRRFSFGEQVAEDLVDADAQALTRATHGRTNIEGRTGRAGAGDIGFSGGHSRNDVQRVINAHRFQFAKESGQEVSAFVQEGDLVVLAGVEEARSQLLNALPEGFGRELIVTGHDPTGQADTALFEYGAERALEGRFAAADRRAEEILSGAHRDLGVLGLAGVRRAAREGRLGELILHEDVVGHWGSAEDAREHPSRGFDAEIDDLLRTALGLSAEVAFSRHRGLLEEQQGVAALLRF
jgi:hypothetical protein